MLGVSIYDNVIANARNETGLLGAGPGFGEGIVESALLH